MRRCLFVAAVFPPFSGSGVWRPLKLAKYLPQWGWRPTVLTCADRPGHIPVPASATESVDGGEADEVDVVRVGWLPLWRIQELSCMGGAAGRLLGRGDWRGRTEKALWRLVTTPDPWIAWVIPAIRAGLELLRQRDIEAIFSTADPLSAHVVARTLARARGLPWVADFRDIAPLLYADHPRWARRAALNLERATARTAHAVTTPTKGLHEYFIRRHAVPSEKVVLIRNGFDEEDFDGIQPHFEPKMTISYIGMLGGTRRSRELFTSLLRAVAARPHMSGRVVLQIVGRGDAPSAEHLPEQDELPFEVRETGYVPHRTAIGLMLASDVLVVLTHSGEGSRSCVPAKTYEYLRTLRPVLAAVPAGRSELRDFLAERPGVVLATQDDVDDLTRALVKLMDLFLAGKTRQPIRDVVSVQPFSRRRQAGQLATLMDRLLTRRAVR